MILESCRRGNDGDSSASRRQSEPATHRLARTLWERSAHPLCRGTVARKRRLSSEDEAPATTSPRKRRPETSPGNVARKRRPETSPGNVARKRRPETSPGNVARKRRPETSPGN